MSPSVDFLKKMKDLPPLPHESKWHVQHPDAPPPVPSKLQITIDSLPNEILEDIFVLAIRTSFPVEDPSYPQHPLFSKTASTVDPARPICFAPHLLPSIIAQTCHRFRLLALHTPRLWSYIYVTRSLAPRSPKASTSAPAGHAYMPSSGFGTDTIGLERHAGWLPLYLSRSQQSLLHVVVDTTKYPLPPTPGQPGPPPTVDHPLFYVIASSTRWVSFTILASHLGSSSLAPTLQALARVPAPNLEAFRVAADIWREGIVSYDTLPPFFLDGAPKLKHIRLDGAYLTWDYSPLVYPSSPPGPGDEQDAKTGISRVVLAGINSHNIHSLILNFATRYPSFSNLRHLLEHACPNLERLVIRDDLASMLRSIDPPKLPYFDFKDQTPGIDIHSEQLHPPSSSSSSSFDYPAEQLGPPHSPPLSPDNPITAFANEFSTRSSLPSTSRFPAGLLHRFSGTDNSHSGGRSRSSSPSASSSSSSSEHGSEFRKITLASLRHLEIHPYRSGGMASLGNTGSTVNLGGRRIASQSSNSLAGSSSGHTHGPSSRRSSGDSSQIPARFLYLFSTPRLETLIMSTLREEEWLIISEMVGLPEDPVDFAYMRERGLSLNELTEGESTFPSLNTLDIQFLT